VAGVVTNLDGTGFTVTADNGSTIAVTTSATTAVLVAQPATVASLTVGESVTITGVRATDGTVTATVVRTGGTTP
jgi:hypothetical protein